MSAEEDGRNKAINQYKILVAAMFLLGVGLLVCGILGAQNYDSEDSFGPPYFVGGFTGGIMGLLYMGVCSYIVLKAPNMGDDATKKREIGCAITAQYILSMLMFMVCFTGLIFAGIGGLSSSTFDEEVDPQVKTLSICILVGCLVLLGVSIFGMVTVCTYGVYFGVHITSRRRRVLLLQTNQTVFATSGAGHGANGQVQSLEEQNRLLRMQLELQQQQLQLQQQNAGMYPPPPPSYNDSAYPPSNFPAAPPPNYDKVV